MESNSILIKKMYLIDIGGETKKDLKLVRVRVKGLVIRRKYPTSDASLPLLSFKFTICKRRK